jgi:hypothetical protein
MILTPAQVAQLLGTAELLGHPLERLRRKLAENDSDANQLELATIIAGLSIGEIEPEFDEHSAQPARSADVRCVAFSGARFQLESLHVGAELPPDPVIRPPLHVGFAARAEVELERAGVPDGKRIRLQFLAPERGAAPHFPPRSAWDELFGGEAFRAFATQLQENADGRAEWTVKANVHAMLVRAVGFNWVERGEYLPPDFREHPIYKGIKRKMDQVRALASAEEPVVLVLSTTCVPLLKTFIARANWTSTQVCRAAFGVPGVGELTASMSGTATLGKIQGSERVSAAIVLETSNRNYFPPHSQRQLVVNRHAAFPLSPEALQAIGCMLVLTHHGPDFSAAELCASLRLRREALTWNARPDSQRYEAIRAIWDAHGAQTRPTGELADMLRRGHRIIAGTDTLSVWPGEASTSP